MSSSIFLVTGAQYNTEGVNLSKELERKLGGGGAGMLLMTMVNLREAQLHALLLSSLSIRDGGGGLH